jgi:hypothetical protein
MVISYAASASKALCAAHNDELVVCSGAQAGVSQDGNVLPLMLALILAIFTAQATPSPTPPAAQPSATQPAPAWTVAPLERASEYAHLVRHELDGTVSDLSAEQQTCDCQPDHAIRMLQSIFKPMSGVSTQTDAITACGQPADRILVTGLAAPKNSRRNIEVVMFRDSGKLYSLTYSFRYVAPMSDAESELLTLCAKSPT